MSSFLNLDAFSTLDIDGFWATWESGRLDDQMQQYFSSAIGEISSKEVDPRLVDENDSFIQGLYHAFRFSQFLLYMENQNSRNFSEMLTESEQACRQLQDELYQAQEQHRRSVEESATVRMLQAQIKDNEDLFQEEINELQNRLLAAEESVEEARRQLEEAETQSSLHNQEVLQLQDQIATYERRLEQTNRETMQRDRVRSAGQEEVNRLNVLVEELEARTHFMQLSIESNEQKIASLTEDRDQLIDRLSDLQQVLDEKDLTINELEAEIESRSREYEQVMNQLDETTRNFEEASEKISEEAASILVEREKLLKDARIRNERLSNENEMLCKRVKELESEIETARVENIGSNHAESTQILEEKNLEIEELRIELATAKAALAVVGADGDDGLTMSKILATPVASKTNRGLSLVSRSQSSMDRLDSLRSKDEEKARADALHARSRELEHQLRDTRALNGQLNREIVQLRSKVHDLESGEYGLPEAEQKITELEEQLERQIEQITSINFALSRRNKDIDKLAIRADRYRAYLPPDIQEKLLNEEDQEKLDEEIYLEQRSEITSLRSAKELYELRISQLEGDVQMWMEECRQKNLRIGNEAMQLGLNTSQVTLLMELSDQMRVLNRRSESHNEKSLSRLRRCQELLDRTASELGAISPNLMRKDDTTVFAPNFEAVSKASSGLTHSLELTEPVRALVHETNERILALQNENHELRDLLLEKLDSVIQQSSVAMSSVGGDFERLPRTPDHVQSSTPARIQSSSVTKPSSHLDTATMSSTQLSLLERATRVLQDAASSVMSLQNRPQTPGQEFPSSPAAAHRERFIWERERDQLMSRIEELSRYRSEYEALKEKHDQILQSDINVHLSSVEKEAEVLRKLLDEKTTQNLRLENQCSELERALSKAAHGFAPSADEDMKTSPTDSSSFAKRSLSRLPAQNFALRELSVQESGFLIRELRERVDESESRARDAETKLSDLENELEPLRQRSSLFESLSEIMESDSEPELKKRLGKIIRAYAISKTSERVISRKYERLQELYNILTTELVGTKAMMFENENMLRERISAALGALADSEARCRYLESVVDASVPQYMISRMENTLKRVESECVVLRERERQFICGFIPIASSFITEIERFRTSLDSSSPCDSLKTSSLEEVQRVILTSFEDSVSSMERRLHQANSQLEIYQNLSATCLKEEESIQLRSEIDELRAENACLKTDLARAEALARIQTDRQKSVHQISEMFKAARQEYDCAMEQVRCETDSDVLCVKLREQLNQSNISLSEMRERVHALQRSEKELHTELLKSQAQERFHLRHLHELRIRYLDRIHSAARIVSIENASEKSVREPLLVSEMRLEKNDQENAVLRQAYTCISAFEAERLRYQSLRNQVESELDHLRSRTKSLSDLVATFEKSDPSSTFRQLHSAHERYDRINLQLKAAERRIFELEKQLDREEDSASDRADRLQSLERQLVEVEGILERERDDHVAAMVTVEEEISLLKDTITELTREEDAIAAGDRLVRIHGGHGAPKSGESNDLSSENRSLRDRVLELELLLREREISIQELQERLNSAEEDRVAALERERIAMSSGPKSISPTDSSSRRDAALQMTIDSLYTLLREKEEQINTYITLLEEARRERIEVEETHQNEISRVLERFKNSGRVGDSPSLVNSNQSVVNDDGDVIVQQIGVPIEEFHAAMRIKNDEISVLRQELVVAQRLKQSKSSLNDENSQTSHHLLARGSNDRLDEKNLNQLSRLKQELRRSEQKNRQLLAVLAELKAHVVKTAQERAVSTLRESMDFSDLVSKKELEHAEKCRSEFESENIKLRRRVESLKERNRHLSAEVEAKVREFERLMLEIQTPATTNSIVVTPQEEFVDESSPPVS